MLFAHGYGCDQSMWRFITPAFADDYRLVLFDHVGAGRSDLSAYSRAKYSTLQAYADDVLEICAAVNLTHGVFVGHSVSAMIGVLAAIAEPERFDQLVLIGPSPRYTNTADYVGGFSEEDIAELLDFQDANYLGWSSNMAPAIMGNPDRPELGEELTNSFCRTDPDIARQFAAVTFSSDNRGELARNIGVGAAETIGQLLAQFWPVRVAHDRRGHVARPAEIVRVLEVQQLGDVFLREAADVVRRVGVARRWADQDQLVEALGFGDGCQHADHGAHRMTHEHAVGEVHCGADLQDVVGVGLQCAVLGARVGAQVGAAGTD